MHEHILVTVSGESISLATLPASAIESPSEIWQFPIRKMGLRQEMGYATSEVLSNTSRPNPFIFATVIAPRHQWSFRRTSQTCQLGCQFEGRLNAAWFCQS